MGAGMKRHISANEWSRFTSGIYMCFCVLQKSNCILPEDLKDFYLTTDGFSLTWSSKLESEFHRIFIHFCIFSKCFIVVRITVDSVPILEMLGTRWEDTCMEHRQFVHHITFESVNQLGSLHGCGENVHRNPKQTVLLPGAQDWYQLCHCAAPFLTDHLHFKESRGVNIYGLAITFVISDSLVQQYYLRHRKTKLFCTFRQNCSYWTKKEYKSTFTEGERTWRVKDAYVLLVAVMFTLCRLLGYLGYLWPLNSQTLILWANRLQVGRTVVSFVYYQTLALLFYVAHLSKKCFTDELVPIGCMVINSLAKLRLLVQSNIYSLPSAPTLADLDFKDELEGEEIFRIFYASVHVGCTVTLNNNILNPFLVIL